MTTTTATRVTVTHSGDGTTAEIHGGRDDVEAREAAKRAGFRWSRNLGAWYLPRTFREPTRAARARQLVASLPDGAVVIEDNGPESTRTAAEVETERIARAENRAERLDERAEQHSTEAERRTAAAGDLASAIPFGQPILVGHHSEGRHRRDLARIQANDHAAWDAQKKADHAAQRADTARATAAGPTPRARLRRIETNEAEARKIARTLAELDAAGVQQGTGYRRRLQAEAERLADQIAHDRAAVEAAAVRLYVPTDIQRGDLVKYRGKLRRVVRVNRKSVSVETGYSWTDTAELHQVTAVYRPTGNPDELPRLVEPASAEEPAPAVEDGLTDAAPAGTVAVVSRVELPETAPAAPSADPITAAVEDGRISYRHGCQLRRQQAEAAGAPEPMTLY